MRVLVTGSSGFVGGAVVARLLGDPAHEVVTVSRRHKARSQPRMLVHAGGELGPDTDWSEPLHEVDGVIHLAARVHVMSEVLPNAVDEYRRVNVAGTVALARQAAAAGVRRFVFVSSIKVNGEMTQPGRPFRADDEPLPVDSYGHSKLEAERKLRDVAAASGMELVIVRPPLVYGPGVRANFQTMMRWLHRGIPLPFGAIDNRRSLVALDNLSDLLVTALLHPAAAGHTFLASDGEDLSTSELLRRLARAMGRRSRLLPLPERLLRLAFRSLGQRSIEQRLCDSLQVDIAPTREHLQWRPPVSVDEAFDQTCRAFLEEGHKGGS